MEGPGTAPDGPTPLPPPEPPSPPPPRFGPGAAIIVFLAYLGAQLAVALAVLAIVAILAGGRTSELADLIEERMPTILLLSVSLGGAAALLTTRGLAGPLRTGKRFALRPGSLGQMLVGAGAGAILGISLRVFVGLRPPKDVDTTLTRLARTEPGLWSLVLLALVLAPPIEEFVFRGVLYEGFRARLHRIPAMLVVTILFTGLHASELVHYPPGFVFIALLSVMTLVLREATGSLFPAVLAHFVYNVCAVFSPDS